MPAPIFASGPTREVFTHAYLQRAFGGVLRHFVLGGTDLHDDEDARAITVISDDERPFVLYGDQMQATTGPSAVAGAQAITISPEKKTMQAATATTCLAGELHRGAHRVIGRHHLALLEVAAGRTSAAILLGVPTGAA